MLSEDLTSRQKSERLMQQLDAVARDPDYWFPFARPFAPVVANPTAEYYFGYGVGPNNVPSLEAVKTWLEGDVRRFDTFTIAEYDVYDDARDLEEELENLQRGAGIQAALNLAEDMATAGGYLDPFRDDPRVFFQDDGPPDLFTTQRQRELALPDGSEMDTEPFQPLPSDPDVAMEGAAWFEATFTHPERELLQPLDDIVNYAVVVRDADPWTSELAVEKYWKLPGGHRGIDSLTLGTFDPEDEAARERAEADRQGLLETYDERGLEGLMHQAELAAMQSGWLDGNRADTRLFRQGPPDRFETLAERLRDEPNPYWNTEADDPAETPAIPDTVDAYWKFVTLPASTPSGESLGEALHMVIYPSIAHDAGSTDGSPIPKDESFKILEVAHFETSGGVEDFKRDFNSYLIPGLLEGPELAVEVARLEGLSGVWRTLESEDLKAFHDSKLSLIRETSAWHIHNPHAERDAQWDQFGPNMDL